MPGAKPAVRAQQCAYRGAILAARPRMALESDAQEASCIILRRQVMEVFEAVRTVLAVRKYLETPVPPEVVRRIVEAGRLTASSGNSQPWHFIVVENRETLRQLGALARTGPYIAQAPLAVVVAIEETKLAVSDTSRAIQSMILTAWSDGVGSNWVGFLGFNELKSLLGIPDALNVLTVLPFGYPAQTLGRGKKQRKPLADVAHRERFSQPFE
jgi:nitroreductase